MTGFRSTWKETLTELVIWPFTASKSVEKQQTLQDGGGAGALRALALKIASRLIKQSSSDAVRLGQIPFPCGALALQMQNSGAD